MRLFLKSFIPFLEDIAEGIDGVGLNLSSELKKPENKVTRNIIALDILYRIHTNIKTILLLFNEVQSSQKTQYSLSITYVFDLKVDRHIMTGRICKPR